MKNMLKLLLPLTAISAVCAAVLAVVDSFTRLPIANIATLKANRAAQAVMPAGVKALVARPDPADTNVVLFVGYADDARTKVLGYAVPGTSPNGYGGDIRLMVGLTADRAVVTYQVLAANETPGLGAKLGDAAFAAQFAGQPAAALRVKKDGGPIDALTGATITSRAVCEALADAVARVDRLEGKPSAAVPAAPPPPQEGRLILD
ncbi:MAG: RnfABCDGE type electron transport complex subunit G, partial [bacterium]|nr:RnfABCDGE type electron transport complex subunit G [bacterium]